MNTNMNENVKTDMEEPMDENMVERANAPRDTWGTGQVTGGKLYCRKQPVAGYEAWGRFDNNAIIPIKAYDSTWYETYWNGNTANVGYVMKQYITNENWNGSGGGSTSGLSAGHYVQVSSSYNSVNVRAQTSTGSTLRGVLLKGTKVYCSAVPSNTVNVNEYLSQVGTNI